MEDLCDGYKIIITYDETLQLITDKSSEECFISRNTLFFISLASILESYPEIKRRFPPGILGFTVNGEVPELDTILKEGDVVHFCVPQLGDHLVEGK
jgi:molybdopterin converting factor small subunit